MFDSDAERLTLNGNHTAARSHLATFTSRVSTFNDVHASLYAHHLSARCQYFNGDVDGEKMHRAFTIKILDGMGDKRLDEDKEKNELFIQHAAQSACIGVSYDICQRSLINSLIV